MTRRGMRGARSAVLLVVLAAGLASAATATAQDAPTGVGLELQPGKVEQDLDGRSFSLDLTLANHDAEPLSVTLDVAALGHDLTGTPQFPSARAVDRAMRLDQDALTLAAGERRVVAVTGTVPKGKRALYASVVATFEPVTGGATGKTVDSVSRIASFFLLRAPGPWVERIEVVDTGFLETDEGTSVYAVVKNTGDVHVRPVGSVRVLHDGEQIAEIPLGSEIVLPGYSRRLVATWKAPEDLTGAVEIQARFTDPAAQGTRTLGFEEGAAPEAQARIVNLLAKDATVETGEEPLQQRDALVTLGVENTGEVPLKGAHVTLIAKDGEAERARIVLPQEQLAPGELREVEWKPSLAAGTYQIVAELSQGERLLDSNVTGVRLGVDRRGEPLSRERGYLGAAAAALAAAMLGAALWVALRRRRRPAPVVPVKDAPATAPAREERPLTRTAKR